MISGAMVENVKPKVVAIMLTADRPEMAGRALRCFCRQTYPNKHLLVLDSTQGIAVGHMRATREQVKDLVDSEISSHGIKVSNADLGNIGYLRNYANRLAIADFEPDIFVHWDDDDVSGPERIEQQVGFLKETRKELVGYRSMYFLDQRSSAVYRYRNPGSGYCLGTSLMYTRRAYEVAQFTEDGPRSRNGSDTGMMRRLEAKMLSAACDGTNERLFTKTGARLNPPMFATLHAQTTNSFNQLAKSLAGKQSEFTIADEESAELVVRMFREA